MKRWPGWDGWTLISLQLLAQALWWTRGLEGLTGPVVAVLAAASAYLLGTWWTRTPDRFHASPPPDIRPLIVIPTHNNATSIAAVVTASLAHGDVLVIDDGSTDGSGDLASQAGAALVRFPTNRGKGFGLSAARSWASG